VGLAKPRALATSLYLNLQTGEKHREVRDALRHRQQQNLQGAQLETLSRALGKPDAALLPLTRGSHGLCNSTQS